MTSRVVLQSQTVCPLQPAANVKHTGVTYMQQYNASNLHAKRTQLRFSSFPRTVLTSCSPLFSCGEKHFRDGET